MTHLSSSSGSDAARLFGRRIGRIRRHVRRYRVGLAVGLIVTAVVAAAGATWLLDWTFRLETAIRAGLLLASLIVVGVVVRRGLRVVGAPATDDGIALALERARPEFRDRLVAAVQFTRARTGGRSAPAPALTTSLEDRVIEDAAAMLRGWNPGRLLRIRPLTVALLLAVLAVGTFSTFAVAFPEHVRVWFRRNLLLQNERWPRATQLRLVGFSDETRVFPVEPGRVWITPDGSRVEMIVETGGVLPDEVIGEVTEIRADGREIRGDPVVFTPTDATRTRWIGGWNEVSGEMRLRVLAGDNDIGPYEIKARTLPNVDSLQVWVTPPAYTRGETWPAPPGREVRCLRASGLWIGATVNQPFESVTVSDGDRDLPVERADNGFVVRLSADRDCTLEVRLADRWGFADPDAATFRLSIVALPDAPPREVVVEPDGLSQDVTPFARLALRIRAFDDHGIARARLRVVADRRDGSGLHRERDLPASGILGTDAEWLVMEEAGPLAPTIGESIIVQATVEDTNVLDGPGVQVGQYSFTVVEPEKLLKSLTERLSEARRRFEGAVSEHRRNTARFDHWLTLPAETDADERLRRVQMADIDSRQRGVTNTVDEVAETYDKLVRELWLNRLIEDDEHRSQQRRVVRPLDRVLENGLRPLRENLRRYRQAAHSGAEPPSASAVQSRFGGTLREMEEILEAMKRLETFAELLEDAESTLKLHQQAHEHTRQAHDARTGDFLDDDDDNGND